MLLVLLVCAAPVIASYFTYFVIRPEGRTNYGTLILPTRSAAGALAAHARRRSRCEPRRCTGQWLLVVVGPAACDAACEQRLYMQRQLREMLGRERDRARQGLAGHRRRRRCAPALRAALRSRRRCTVLRAPRDGAGALAGAGGRPGARGPPLPRRPDGRVDDAHAGRRRAGAASSATSSACCAPRRPGTRPAADEAHAWTRPRSSTSRRSLRLLLLARLIALLPLAWLWLRQRGADAARAAGGADRADPVPDLRPDRLRRLHAPDRFRPGLPRLAGLLRRRPARSARAHDIHAAQTAHARAARSPSARPGSR